jgi:hypothetical protein
MTLSKQIDAGGGSGIACEIDCECDGTRLFTIRQRVETTVSTSVCDELVGEIPDGSRFEADITHFLRLPSACGAWIGYHEGRFRITADHIQIVDGEMRATHGFDLRESGGDRCCAYMHSEGIMTARTTSKDPRFDGCRLIANYRTRQEMGPDADPCDPRVWLYWDLSCSGLLVCSCV